MGTHGPLVPPCAVGSPSWLFIPVRYRVTRAPAALRPDRSQVPRGTALPEVVFTYSETGGFRQLCTREQHSSRRTFSSAAGPRPPACARIPCL